MPKRGVVRFGKHDKLLLRFIGPFEILERVGTVAYRLALQPSMSGVHEVFHVSMLRRYTLDPTHVVDWGEIEVDTYGTFDVTPLLRSNPIGGSEPDPGCFVTNYYKLRTLSFFSLL